MDLEQLAALLGLNIGALTMYAGLVTVLVSATIKGAQAVADLLYRRKHPVALPTAANGAPSIRGKIGTLVALILSALFGLLYTMPWDSVEAVFAAWSGGAIAVLYIFATSTGSYEYFSALIGKFGAAIAAGQSAVGALPALGDFLEADKEDKP